MKKSIGILLITLCCLLTACKKNERYLDNPNKTFLNNSCTSYFYNLGDDYPVNVKGSCGYVAASMLLRYYDYTVNDNIIDLKYQNNMGLKREDYTQIEDMSNDEYLSFLQKTKDTYFHSLLIVSACERYSIYKPASKTPFITYHGDQSRIDGYYSEVFAIIDNYLYDVKGFNEYEIYVSRIQDNVRDEMINLVKAGVPILVNLNYNGKDDHTCIVYDYDEVNDELYANFLMYENYNHVKISGYYNKMNSPLYLNCKKE